MQRHLIMTAESVLATLADLKTQTRRVVQPAMLERSTDPAWLARHAPYADSLWIKETWAPTAQGYVYKAAGAQAKWRSPLFMPRAACRLVIMVNEVSVQPLHDITDADAIAEAPPTVENQRTVLDCYKHQWDILNAKRGYPWASNPLVYVLTYKRII